MPNASENPALEPEETTVEMGRLKGLSDGVFAFALTLLVLEIVVPEGLFDLELPVRLLDLAPKLLIYVISFFVIGSAWASHQRMLSHIRRGDGHLPACCICSVGEIPRFLLRTRYICRHRHLDSACRAFVVAPRQHTALAGYRAG
jgi:uncharacterized membrane protein